MRWSPLREAGASRWLTGGAARYRLLEPLRQFGRERLIGRGAILVIEDNAEELAQKSLNAFGAAKQLLTDSFDTSFETQIEREPFDLGRELESLRDQIGAAKLCRDFWADLRQIIQFRREQQFLDVADEAMPEQVAARCDFWHTAPRSSMSPVSLSRSKCRCG